VPHIFVWVMPLVYEPEHANAAQDHGTCQQHQLQ
jgi:hypothetical protein